MQFPEDEVAELFELSPGAKQFHEGGFTYFFLPGLHLPAGCEPGQVDALLCPMQRDGYVSRLYFSAQVRPAGVENRSALNWNGSVRILERNWHAHSWRTPLGLRIAQMLAIHLKALR
jgi:hypothetical protein